ncbi:apolipoprotein N-acyltransferase [Streptomyces sp. NPDC059637]|uniref:apolipoprotein N-acyltransferase n=1 Tax=Streptomyces sp. NPDC059637 TaxID=3347752 RepID=UPI00369AFA17
MTVHARSADAAAPAAAAPGPDRKPDPASAPPRTTAEATGGTPAPAAVPGAPAERPGRLRRAGASVRRNAPRTAVAAAAGAALALAFPPYDLWPLSLLAVAALALLARGRTARQGAWLGFALGLPFFAVLLVWLRVIGFDAVIGLAVVEALFFVPMGAGLAVTSRLPAAPLWGACLWVAQEWARDRLPFGGFPWGRLAFANTATPFTPLAALGGAPLVTFAVALTGGLAAAAAAALWSLRRRAEPGERADGPAAGEAGDGESAGTASGGPAGAAAGARPRRPTPAVAAAGAAALAAAVTCAGYAVPVPTAADDTVSVAVVQGNVQQPGMDFLGRPMLILNNHVEATLGLAEDVEAGRLERPDLVIWPENSSDLDPTTVPEARAAIDRAARAVGAPILVGALVDGPDEHHVQNNGIVWDPATGPGASYTKQHPVPFGEYVPYREALSKVITRLERVPRDFWPGEGTGVLQVGPARLGDVICFEVAYDGIVRGTVNDGARAVVVQTNNATYGNTGQPEQQLAMSRLRAVEHGRAFVTAATSGISAVVSPDGRVLQRTEEFTQDVLTADLPLRDARTVADRVGALPEWTLAIVGLLAWGTGSVLARPGRRDQKGQQ